MQRLSQILKKKIRRDRSLMKIEWELVQRFSQDWTLQKQPLPIKTKWDLVRASVVLQGVSNKRTIERAYIKVMDGMENYWQVLDYKERNRILNIDLAPAYALLPSFFKNDEKIIIPFFDQRINELYQKEMAIFELKQYHLMMHDYRQWIQPVEFYQYQYFNGTFVPSRLIAHNGNDIVLYHPQLQSLLAVVKGQELVLPLFDEQMKPFMVNDEILQVMAQFVLHNDVAGFMNSAVAYQLYHETIRNWVLKKHHAKGLFSIF